jgi:hypothetical protein
MNRAAAGKFAGHRAFEQHRHRRRAAEQFVGGHHRGDGAGAAAADAARQRQSFLNRQPDAARRLEAPEQLGHRGRRGVLPRIPGQSTAVTLDRGNRHTRCVLRGGDDDVARLIEGKPHDVEAARDV